MSRGTAIILAIIIAMGSLGFLFVRAIRAPAGVTDVKPVRTDILSSDVSDKIKAREVNGAIPVQVLPENYGRDDPFADF